MDPGLSLAVRVNVAIEDRLPDACGERGEYVRAPSDEFGRFWPWPIPDEVWSKASRPGLLEVHVD